MDRTNSLIQMCLMVLSLLLVERVYQVLISYSDPFFYEKVTILTPTVKPGDILLEQIHLNRYRLCDTKVDRFMARVDNKEVFSRVTDIGGASELGYGTITIRIKVPEDAPIGKAYMIQRTISKCNDGIHVTPWPMSYFEIVSSN